jgi:predicted GIY-YIG superfamily endonuclease
MSGAYIYIPGSHTGTLCIGVTNNLYLRVMHHKEGTWGGFGGRKAPSRIGKISTAEVPSATLGTGSSTPRHQTLYHAINR